MARKKTNNLSGVWKLVSIETRKEDDAVFRRGKRTGYLLYSDDGYMSVAYMKEGRPNFTSGDIRGGTIEEKLAAIDGYNSYCGQYEVKGDIVIHKIDVSLFPNWVGHNQERKFDLKGNQLTLSTPLMLVGGRQLSTHLIWERV
jgi:hypothetical protein